MPGPRSGITAYWPLSNAVIHKDCMNGARCKGPGCVLATGKTAKAREKHGGKKAVDRKVSDKS